MTSDTGKFIRKPISRRQFLRYSVASGASFWLLSQGGYSFAQNRNGTMVWLGHHEVAGFGPNDTGTTVQAVLIYNILNPLLHVNHLTELEPVLMESVDVSDDGLQYTFKLRQGVPFHDGTEFTAEDVKFTFDYYSQPGNAIANNFLGMGSVEVADKYTVVVNMNEINAAFLAQAGEVPIVPAAYHQEVGEDGFRTKPIGTGAFRLREWRPAEFTEIEAFDDHFRGRPGVEAIRLEVVPEPSVRYIALQTGQAHSSVWPLLAEDSLSFEGDPDFRVVRTLANSIKYFPINNQLPQLSDKRVRQALMYALDRQRIIDDLWAGAAQVAHSYLTPKNAFYHTEDVKRYDFNPERARSLLDEAGWVEGSDGVRSKDGMRLSFTCTTITGDQARRPIAELTQQLFRDVGVEMQLAEAPVASILEMIKTGDLDASLFNWTHGGSPEPDPSNTLRSDGGDNFSNYSNPEMDRLIDAGLETVDPEERKVIYHQIQQLFAEDVPSLYLQFDEWINVYSSDVQGMPDEIFNGDPIYYMAHKLSLG